MHLPNVQNSEKSHYPQSLFRLGKEAFNGDDALTQISIPCKVESIGTGAFNCKNLISLVVEPHNPSYISDNDVLYSRNGSALVKYANGKKDSEFVIPQHVAKIGEDAFADCQSLTSVILPQGVNIIAKGAFRSCSNIVSIVIPDGVEKIDEEAFADCKNLRSISLPQGMTSIGKRAFCNCQSIEEIILPSSIMKIDDEAFLNCSKLENINIPTTVEYVGRDILKGSISEKKSI